jgi:hypothetical protein
LKKVKEKWEPIVGYEGFYEVSNWGRIRSVPRVIFTVNRKNASYKRIIKGGLLKLNTKWSGYPRVKLTRNSEYTKHSVHRLVAEAFLPNPDNKPCVNHKNGIRTDNYYHNLEWATYQENSQHAVDTGLNSGPKGEKCGNSKLKEEEVLKICYMVDYGELTQKQIAKIFGISNITVSNISRGNSWSHITGRNSEVPKTKFSKGRFHPRSISVINCKGQIFNTMQEAAEAYSLSNATHLAVSCRSTYKTAGKYPDGTSVKWSIYENK